MRQSMVGGDASLTLSKPASYTPPLIAPGLHGRPSARERSFHRMMKCFRGVSTALIGLLTVAACCFAANQPQAAAPLANPLQFQPASSDSAPPAEPQVKLAPADSTPPAAAPAPTAAAAAPVAAK